MTSSDPQTKLNAMMIEALYRTGARMGNLNAQSLDKKTGKKVPTYGLSTLLVKHVRELANGGLNLIFAGKANMQHKLALRPDDKWSQMLIDYIKELCQGKRPSDFVFTMENGKRNQPANINKALQEHGWAGTSHKMRHVLGTQLLMKLMEQKPLPAKADQAKTDAYVDKMMIAVGNALGHKRIIDGQVEPTGATARGSYIDPTLLIKLYRDRNLNLPRWLEKLENIKEEDEE